MQRSLSWLLLFIIFTRSTKCILWDPSFNDTKLYDRINQIVQIRPSGPDDGPVEVNMSAIINNVNLNVKNNLECSVSLTVKYQWTDTRIKFNHIGKHARYLTVKDVSKMWTPDTYMYTENIGKKNYGLLTPQRFVKIYADGNIILSTEIRTDVPFKRRINACLLMITKDLWANDHFTQKWIDQVPKYIESTHQLASDIAVIPGIDNEWRSTIRINVNANFSLYIVSIIYPYWLAVIVSWLTLFIHPKDYVARIITLMFLISCTSNIKHHLILYQFVFELIVTSQIVIFGTLLETTLIGYIVFHYDKRNDRTDHQSASLEAGGYHSSDLPDNQIFTIMMPTRVQHHSSVKQEPLEMTNNLALLMDAKTRWILPVLYLVFNLMFWFFG